MMWLVDPIKRCCGFSSSRKFVTDFCQHGARWRKQTRIQTWHCQPCSALEARCTGRNGFCSATGKKHIVLKGQDVKTRQLWTHLAQPYPLRFCEHGAKLLIHSAEAIQSFKLSQWFQI